MSCKSGHFQNGIFTCQNHLPCYEGGKTADGRCAACQVTNFLMCDGDIGKCIKCKENMTYNTISNTCEEYINLNIESECRTCDLTNTTLINTNGVCSVVKSNVAVHSLSNVVEFKYGFYIQNNVCNDCTTYNNGSLLCSSKIIEKCDKTYYVKEDGSVCVKNVCSDGINNKENGKCAPQIDNCIKYVNGMCVECSSKYSYDGNASCVESSAIDVNCGTATPVGCIRCDGNTYLNVSTHKCETCNSNCESCLNLTMCLSCVDGYFLSDYTCKSNDALNDTCARKVPYGNGCLVCKVGYYKKGADCVLCDVKCGECLTENSCIKCNATNYKTSNGDCLPRSSITTCAVEVTESGCSTCKDGYYTVNGNECQKCVEGCAKCSEQNQCISCDDTFVLKSTMCVSYNTITKCTKTKDSKCSSCTFWYSPSDDGTHCSKTAV
ncbi:hypothetical protein EIN_326520 [Entamoeba invadens IP1]|uniref:Uncharacterized protein n=1 Tax=Entamoeba invadens IP1 TaxID=370355 RepID=A0A0A1TXI2_ENTIV|nr:hypothetical protein EIN_326520 [Entamoeba invadens IP1]ELP86055.1 hypothetical protein EIN_326520 [Entamoeba invadens IP1]|eukprot:XP_004185401.1 hypothetical protein EIN_326520 [Entamoeba invadens IP1]